MNKLIYSFFACIAMIMSTPTLIFGQSNLDPCLCNRNKCGDITTAFELVSGKTVVCEGEEFEVNNRTTSDVNIDYFIWDWGDGTSDTVYNQQNVTHIYQVIPEDQCDESTLYQVCLLAVTLCGDEYSCHNTNKPVEVINKPKADFQNPEPLCPGEEVILENTSCNEETYLWEFQGGRTSTEENPSISFDAPGTYSVKLTVSNECGSSSVTKTIKVLGIPETEIELLTNGGVGCRPDRQMITFRRDPWLFDDTGDWTWKITPNHIGGAWCVTNDTTFLKQDKCVPQFSNPSGYLDVSDTLDIYFTESGVYGVELNYKNKCIDTTIVDSIYIYETINLGPFNDINSCEVYTLNYSDLSDRISGDILNYDWTFTNGSQASYSGADGDFGSVTFSESGSVTLQAQGYPPCANETVSFDISVLTNLDPAVPALTPNAICLNAENIPLNPMITGGEYYYNGQVATFIDFDTLVPSLLPSNTTSFTIEHRVGVGTTCPRDTTFTFTTIPSPEISLGENPQGCDVIMDFTPNIIRSGGDIDNWMWTIFLSDGSEYLSSTSALPSFDLQLADTYTIVVKASSNECGEVSDTSRVLVAENIPAAIDQGKMIYCLSDMPDTLSAVPDGGTWSGDGITNTNLGILDVSLLTPGMHTIRYSLTSACTSEDQIDIEVVVPEAIITPDTFYCITDAPTELVISPNGGVFSGVGILDEMTGLFDPNVSGSGVQEITYNFTDNNGCVIDFEFDVTVDSIPALSALDTFFVCATSENLSLPNILRVRTSGEMGSFNYSGPGVVDAQTGSFNSSGLDLGFHTIEIEFITRSCTNNITAILEVGERPDLSITLDTILCITSGTFQLMSNLSGGTWASMDCEVDAETGMIDLVASGSGMGRRTCVFEYITDEGTSCEQRASTNITLVDLAADLTVPAPSIICYRDGNYTLTGFGPASGLWTGDGVVDATNGVIDVRQLTPGTTYNYDYCVKSDDVDCEACKSTTLEIAPLPIAQYDDNIAPCLNQAFTLNNQSLDATSYEWNFGDGTTSNMVNPTKTYASAGSFDLRLIAITDNGCRDTIINPIYVTSPPVLDFTMTTMEGCAPLELEYINNSSGENVGQFWIIEGVDTIIGANPLIVLDSVLMDSIMTVELVIFNDCEEKRRAVDVLVHPYPFINFGVNNEESCSPDTVLIGNATQGQPDILQWDFGNGNTSTAYDPPYQIYTTPDDSVSIYTVVLTATNMCGSRIDSQQVRVLPNMVEAFFQLDQSNGCPPLEVTLQNFATVGSTVTYDFGDGATSSEPNTTHIYTEPGEYVITQYAISCGLDSIKSDTIRVHPLADLNFDAPEFVCLGDTAHFTNSSTSGNTVEWYFGDGTESNVTNPSHVYTNSGTYEVQLVMYSDFFDCPDTLTKSIFVPPVAVARFIPDPLEICPLEIINFTNQSQGATNYYWDFGNGVTSNEFEPGHTYTDAGVYEIKLSVFDEYGCQFDTTKINMLVHEKPVSQFALDVNNICQFYDTLSTINTSSPNTTNTWYLNDQILSDQSRDITFFSDTPGSNRLELISTSPFDCKDTSSQIFNVLPSPIAQIDIGEVEGCQPLTVMSNDISINSDNTLWIYDGLNTSNDPVSTFEYLDHGDYNLTLVASSDNQCPNDTTAIDIRVNPKAIANYSMELFDSCGTPKPIKFVNNSQYSEDYLWAFGNGETSNLLNPSTIYSSPGLYNVDLLANNLFDCPDQITQQVAIYPQPVASFELPEIDVCLGDSIRIINSTTNANNYSWFLNDQILLDDPLIISESGTYQLKLIARYDNLCIDTLAYDEIVTVYESPVSIFEAISDESESIIGDVRFVNLSQNADAYNWDFGDGNTSFDTNPSHEYDINGPVGVTLIAHNDNNGLFRCSNSSFAIIQYELINKFFAPNAMSPDQNFGNDLVGVFKPVGVAIDNYKLEIYSPWGDKVAELSEVLNGEPIDFWDGTYKGSLVPQGTYLWKATINYNSGHSEFKSGNVTVIR